MSVGGIYAIMQPVFLTVMGFFLVLAKQKGNPAPEFIRTLGVNTDWNLWMMFWYPHGVMWYIAALFQWRLLAPYWYRLKYPLMSAVVVCVVSPYAYVPEQEGNTFISWDRTWSLLPLYILGVQMKSYQHVTNEVFSWSGMREATFLALTTNLIFVMVNIASSNGYGAFAYDTVIDAWSEGLPDTAFYSIEMVDDQCTTPPFMGAVYSSWVYYTGFYGPLCAVFGKFVMVVGIVASASNEVIDNVFGIPFDFTKRGADSVVNYLMHMFVVYSVAIAGLFDEFTMARWLGSVAISCVSSQFWMWEPVASTIKDWLIFPASRKSLLRRLD